MPTGEPQLLDEVLAAYGLPLPHAMRPATLGVQNDVWLLDFDTELLDLKRFRRGDATTVRAMTAVMDRVGERIPVPRLKAHAGDDVVLDSSSGLFTLSEHARGWQPNRTELTVQDAAAMGRTLGRLHALPDATDLHLPMEVALVPTSEVLSRVERVLRAIPGGAPADEAAIAHLNSRAQWLRRATDEPAPPDRAVRLVHGDFNDSNMFFAEGEVSAVIDWDQTHRGSSDHELMRSADYSFADREDLWAAFLMGYREHRPLELVDLDIAAEAYAFRRDRGLWAYEEFYLRGNQAVQSLIQSPDFIPWMRRWQRTRPHLL